MYVRSKDVKNVKGGKQKLSNMKYLVKQIIRAVGIANRHDLIVQTGPQGRYWIYIWVLGIYLLFLDCQVIKGDAMKQYHGSHISMRCRNRRADYLGSSDGMSSAGGIGLLLQ